MASITVYRKQPMADLFSGIGSALGGLFGGLSALASTQAGIGAVQGMTDTGALGVLPYDVAGLGYLDQTSNNLQGTGVASQNIGQGRLDNPTNPVDFQNFAKNYNTSEGAQYLMDTAKASQDDSAAARGGLLSGANLRAQTGIAEGIANQDLLSQYQATESGQQQDFAQRQTAEQNLVGQENMGLQAGLGLAGTYAQGARAVGSLYGGLTSATSAAGSQFGSGLGSLFGGLLGKLFS